MKLSPVPSKYLPKVSIVLQQIKRKDFRKGGKSTNLLPITSLLSQPKRFGKGEGVCTLDAVATSFLSYDLSSFRDTKPKDAVIGDFF